MQPDRDQVEHASTAARRAPGPTVIVSGSSSGVKLSGSNAGLGLVTIGLEVLIARALRESKQGKDELAWAFRAHPEGSPALKDDE